MKKSIAFILSAAVLMLCGCASLRLTPEEQARIAEQVQENLDNRTFEIDVDQMISTRGRSQHVTNYSIKVDGAAYSPSPLDVVKEGAPVRIVRSVPPVTSSSISWVSSIFPLFSMVDALLSFVPVHHRFTGIYDIL